MSVPSVIKTSSPFTHLNAVIHQNANNSSYLGRIWKTMKMIKERDGYLVATAVSCGVVAASLYTATFSYFCAEGAGRSLEEAYSIFIKEGKLAQSLGDAGGWISLPIFSFYTFKTTLKQCLGEGEFAEVKVVCKDWYRDILSKNISIQNSLDIPVEEFYDRINHILESLAQQCFFYKSHVGSKLIALNIIEEIKAFDEESELNPFAGLTLDKRLKFTYQEINKKIQNILSVKKYFHRIKTGLSSTQEQYGTRCMVGNVISGIAIPIIFNLTCILSIMGEVALGKKLFENKEDLVEVGHFGEWPDNFAEAALFGYFLNKDLILKGDVSLVTDIFQQHLDALDPDKDPINGNQNLFNRLCEVANAELNQLSSSGFFSKRVQLNKFQLR